MNQKLKMLRHQNKLVSKIPNSSLINRESCKLIVYSVIFLNNKKNIEKSFYEEYYTQFKESKIDDNRNCLIKIFLQDLKSNSTNFNNSNNPNNSLNELEIDLNYPDEVYIKETLNYLSLLTENLKNEICSNCLNKFDLWKDVDYQVNKISHDIELLITKNFDSGMHISSLLAFKINQLNTAISRIEKSKLLMKIIKEIKCKNESQLEEVYNNIWKISSDLVDSIQKSVRTKNLNVNIILIQEK